MNDLVASTRFACQTWLAFAVLAMSICQGQPPAESGRVPVPIPAGTLGSVQETGPQVYHLRDENGELVVVPDFSFERYQRLIRLEKDYLPTRSPGYEFPDKIVIRGESKGGYAAISVTIPIRITAAAESAGSWVRVPLRLNQAIRDPEIVYQGPGKLAAVQDSEVEGHVVWLEADAGTDHTIRLTAKVPIRQVGNERQFDLMVPLGGLDLTLTIPATDLKASLGEGPASMLTEQELDGTTLLHIESNGGKLALVWRKENRTPMILESTGSMTVRVDGHQLTCDAQLNVRSHGTPMESILVRLPPRMELISTDREISELQIDTEDIAGAERESTVIRVHRRDGRETTEFDIPLRAVLSLSHDEVVAAAIELAGFEVQGSRIQSGTIDVEVNGDWDTEFVIGDRVRQDGQFPDPLRPSDIVARFTYTAQPFSLQLRLRERKSRVQVEPLYTVFIEPDQARLVGKLMYQISGARAEAIRLNLGNWVLDEVSPAELLARPATVGEDATLVISLATSSYTVPGQLELEIKAHREISIESAVELGLPSPAGETTSALGGVAIVPADNLQLSPRAEEIRGLVAEVPPGGLALPSRQQTPQFYRETPGNDPPKFVADVQIRERSVTAWTESQVSFAKGQALVQQRFRYRIDYEPVSELSFQVPSSLAPNTTFRFESSSGQPLEVEWDGEPLAESLSGATHELRVLLREEQIGDHQISLSYSLPVEIPSADESVRVLVPLVLPLPEMQLSLRQHTLKLPDSGGLQVELQGGGWSRGVSDGDADADAYELLSDTAAVELALAIDSSPRQPATRLRRVWAQSWLTGGMRRERVVFQLSTSAADVQILLPVGLQASEVQVLVGDRLWQNVIAEAENVIEIELPDSTNSAEHTFELWYWLAVPETTLKRLAVELPAIAGIAKAERTYWQLVLPENEHLVWPPEGLTRQYQWRWNRFLWERKSNKGLSDLEALLAASRQDPLPEARNEYLFSTVGSLQDAEFHTISRATFVLAASGAVLLAGLLLIYLPALRHPAMLLTAGVGVLAVGCVFPEPTLFAVQSSLLGVLLVVVAQLLRWGLVGQRYQLAPIFSASEQAPESQPSEHSLSVSEVTTRLPTTISPGPFHVPTADSEA